MKDLKWRMYISESGDLRIVFQDLGNNKVRAKSLFSFKIDGLAVDNECRGYFTGLCSCTDYRNKVIFKD